MAIIELQPYDIYTSPAERIYALQPLWAGLVNIGVRSARLLVVTDHINYEKALKGFDKVAVPFGELPQDLRWYRSYYEDYMAGSVRETQYIRIFLIAPATTDEQMISRLINGYGIQTRYLDAEGIPLPFQTATADWDTATDENGQMWGVVQSDIEQSGAVVSQSLHRVFSLEFPVFCAIDIWNYTRSEAAQMLRIREAVASVAFSKKAQTRADQVEAKEVQEGIDQFKHEMSQVGVGLHEVRCTFMAGAWSKRDLDERIELIRGACTLDLERNRSKVNILNEMFSVDPPKPEGKKGTLATSSHLTVLAGSPLCFSRPTKTEGILSGFDNANAPVVINLFDQMNSAYNACIVGQTGAGKTFFITLLMIRSILTGTRLIIIDPKGDIDFSWLGSEDDGRPLCEKISVGTDEAAINILDPIHGSLSNQIEFVLGGLRLLGVYDGENGIQRTILDLALHNLYGDELFQEGGIVTPTLGDLKAEVERIGQDQESGLGSTEIKEEAAKIAFRLNPFTTGSRRKQFGQATNVDLSLNARVTIIDVSAFPSRQSGGNMRAMLFGTLFGLLYERIKERRAMGDRGYIKFFIDEIGVLMRDAIVADFVSDRYKTARSLGVAMLVADQTLQSLLGAKDETGISHGNEMLANSPFRFIFYQEGSEHTNLKENFPMMPEAYRKSIHRLPRGQCIAQTPQGTFPIVVTPSELEAVLLSSNIKHRQRAEKLVGQMRSELDGAKSMEMETV